MAIKGEPRVKFSVCSNINCFSYCVQCSCVSVFKLLSSTNYYLCRFCFCFVLDLTNKENHSRGPGIRKINCSLLEYENYVNEIALKIPMWIAEGEKHLTDNRSIWEWQKYNIRAHAIQYSIQRAQGRNEKEDSLQTEYSRVSQIYENDINADRLNAAKERLESFYEEKVRRNNYLSMSSLARTRRKKY